MPKILSYDHSARDVRTIEVVSKEFSKDGAIFYIKAERLDDKIVVESISDVRGNICTAADIVRGTMMPIKEIRKLIKNAFER